MKTMTDKTEPFFPSNQPEWRLLAVAGTVVGCLTAIWLPLGVVGFAGFIYLAVLLRPNTSTALQGDERVRAPVDGKILSVETRILEKADEPNIEIRMRAGSFSSQIQCAPVSGVVDSVIWIAGTFAHRDEAGVDQNARREFIFETASQSHISLIQHGDFYTRLLMSFVQEGQRVGPDNKIGVSLFNAHLSIILPAGISVKVRAGQRILAGETVLADLASPDQS